MERMKKAVSSLFKGPFVWLAEQAKDYLNNGIIQLNLLESYSKTFSQLDTIFQRKSSFDSFSLNYYCEW